MMNRKIVTFEIDQIGTKARTAHAVRGRRAIRYTLAETKAYERRIALLAQQALGKDRASWCKEGAFVVDVVIYKTVPVSRPKIYRQMALAGKIRPIARPDVDNTTKAILDAVKGILWRDDTQVVGLHTDRYYAESERIVVTVENVTHEDDRWSIKRSKE